MKQPVRIGLTGGIGSGKSTAADCFIKLGVQVLDADQITRELMLPGQPVFAQIIEHFGGGILTDTGQLDRQKLRHRVFNDTTERELLENMVHPAVYRTLIEKTAHLSSETYVIWMIPLLLETRSRTGFTETEVDRILVIDCPEHLQLERAQARDAAQRDEIERIMQSQMAREERLQQADDVINNTGSKTQLCADIEKLHRYYQQLFTDMTDKNSIEKYANAVHDSESKGRSQPSTKH